MDFNLGRFEELLPGYFSGELSEQDRATVEMMRDSSPENRKIFDDAKTAWNSIALLNEMEKFNPFEALKEVNKRIIPGNQFWIRRLQRIAAVLLIPLLVYSGLLTYEHVVNTLDQEEYDLWETVSCRYGMVSQFQLPDSSTVWLNSGSQLKFPHAFSKKNRTVEITGEAYFKVTHNEQKPFVVRARNLEVKVLGTEFNVSNYSDEANIEVILATGKVKLFSYVGGNQKILGTMDPGSQAIFENKTGKLSANKIDAGKYTLWRNGILSFYNEPMREVVKRLNRWFNADIVIVDKDIEEYVYRATFSSESLEQVMRLLKISAPIDYEFEARKEFPDGTYDKQRIYIKQRKH